MIEKKLADLWLADRDSNANHAASESSVQDRGGDSTEPPTPAATHAPADSEPLAPLPPLPPPAPLPAREAFDWPEPEHLAAQLDELASHEATAHWAKQTLRLIRKLGPEMSQYSEKATATLQRLEEAAAQATGLRAAIKDRAIVEELSRAEHALVRRLDVWKAVEQVRASGLAESPLPVLDPHVLRSCVADIDAMLGDAPERAAWEKYSRFAGVAKLGRRAKRGPRAPAAHVGPGDIEAVE